MSAPAAVSRLETLALSRVRDAGSVATEADVAAWPDLLALSADHKAVPYPVDALPGDIRGAVEEAAARVQCPESIAACSALSALSLAAQALVDVRRTEMLEGPVSLYFIAIADSGDRKTSADRQFKPAMDKWEQKKRDEVAPKLADKRAELASWEAKKESVLQKIKQHKKDGKAALMQEAERELIELERNAPKPERFPQILYADNTPESLAWDLAKPGGWPTGGIMSPEAGIVLGSHGMGKDSLMRNLALLNSLWDGTSHAVNRRTSESFNVRGVRLTMGLAAQSEVVKDFLDNRLARGIGFVARFLIACPASIQGMRPYKDHESPLYLPAFNARIGELLDEPFLQDERGELAPAVLTFSPDAKAAWVKLYNDIEAELSPGRSLSELKDIASKAADNAARLAALFHVYQNGASGQICEQDTTAAARIVTWHLYEARRFLGDIALPQSTLDAKRLSEWLARYCRENKTGTLRQRTAQIYGPIRDGERLNKAFSELEETHHVRRLQEGRQRLVQVNPSLWEG